MNLLSLIQCSNYNEMRTGLGPSAVGLITKRAPTWLEVLPNVRIRTWMGGSLPKNYYDYAPHYDVC